MLTTAHRQTHAVFVAFEQTIYVVRLSACLVVLRRDIKELLSRFGEEAALRDLERTEVTMCRLSRFDLIRFALHRLRVSARTPYRVFLKSR